MIKILAKSEHFCRTFVIVFLVHYDDYDGSVIRDFCDALISAKNDAINESKESAPYLTDNNLAMAIMDLFFGQ